MAKDTDMYNQHSCKLSPTVSQHLRFANYLKTAMLLM